MIREPKTRMSYESHRISPFYTLSPCEPWTWKYFVQRTRGMGVKRFSWVYRPRLFFYPTRRVIWTIRFFKGTRGKGRSRQRQWGRVKGQLRRKGKGRKETFQGFVCALTFWRQCQYRSLSGEKRGQCRVERRKEKRHTRAGSRSGLKVSAWSLHFLLLGEEIPLSFN